MICSNYYISYNIISKEFSTKVTLYSFWKGSTFEIFVKQSQISKLKKSKTAVKKLRQTRPIY